MAQPKRLTELRRRKPTEWLQSHGAPNPRILAHQAQDRPELILFRGFLTKRNGPGELLPGLPGSSLNQFSE